MKNDEIKLLRGNCLELAEQIPDGSIDMVLCDPPYGVTDCRWDSVLPFDAMWRMYERVVKANGAIALFSSQPFTTRLIHSNICQYRYTWYWIKNIKTGHVFAKVQPMRQVEEVCIFYRKKPLYQPQGLVKLEREIIHRKQAQADGASSGWSRMSSILPLRSGGLRGLSGSWRHKIRPERRRRKLWRTMRTWKRGKQLNFEAARKRREMVAKAALLPALPDGGKRA